MSKNTRLNSLYCDSNQLTSLDVSKNTGLTELICRDNQLTSLDVSKNTSLKSMDCDHNQLTSLDVSKNTSLKSLNCDHNQLRSLDISKNGDLKYLFCYGNRFNTLDISCNPHLLEAYIIGEKKEYGSETEYSEPDKCLYVDSSTKLICLSIASQPEDQMAAPGNTVTLSVKANGYDLKYQWYQQRKGEISWTVLTGQTKKDLTFTAAEDQDGSRFKCRIQSKGEQESFELESKEATLTVITKPRITSQPKSMTVKAEKKVTFKVKATGENLKYQWYVKKTGSKKWVKVKKATKPTLKFKATAKMNGYRYRCKVYNEAGYKYSRTVKLKVKKK